MNNTKQLRAQAVAARIYSGEELQEPLVDSTNDSNVKTAEHGQEALKQTWRMPQLDKQIKELYVINNRSSSDHCSVLPTEMINDKDIKDMIPEGGLKYDTSKPRMDLIDFQALEGLADVLTFGAKKYAAHNWRKGISYSRLIAAMLRHLAAIQRGEDIDPESGLPHADHIGCCWMFLSNMMKTRPDLDDRYKC